MDGRQDLSYGYFNVRQKSILERIVEVVEILSTAPLVTPTAALVTLSAPLVIPTAPFNLFIHIVEIVQ